MARVSFLKEKERWLLLVGKFSRQRALDFISLRIVPGDYRALYRFMFMPSSMKLEYCEVMCF